MAPTWMVIFGIFNFLWGSAFAENLNDQVLRAQENQSRNEVKAIKGTRDEYGCLLGPKGAACHQKSKRLLDQAKTPTEKMQVLSLLQSQAGIEQKLSGVELTGNATACLKMCDSIGSRARSGQVFLEGFNAIQESDGIVQKAMDVFEASEAFIQNNIGLGKVDLKPQKSFVDYCIPGKPSSNPLCKMAAAQGYLDSDSKFLKTIPKMPGQKVYRTVVPNKNDLALFESATVLLENVTSKFPGTRTAFKQNLKGLEAAKAIDKDYGPGAFKALNSMSPAKRQKIIGDVKTDVTYTWMERTKNTPTPYKPSQQFLDNIYDDSSISSDDFEKDLASGKVDNMVKQADQSAEQAAQIAEANSVASAENTSPADLSSNGQLALPTSEPEPSVLEFDKSKYIKDLKIDPAKMKELFFVNIDDDLFKIVSMRYKFKMDQFKAYSVWLLYKIEQLKQLRQKKIDESRITAFKESIMRGPDNDGEIEIQNDSAVIDSMQTRAPAALAAPAPAKK